MKNILLTGGAGYIGSHVANYLLDRGFKVSVIDNLSTGWSDAVQYGPLENVDLLDIQKLDGVFAKYRPKAVMHFAAYSQVAESFLDPLKYWRNNVLGSLNLFEVCVAHGCNNVIFSSPSSSTL